MLKKALKATGLFCPPGILLTWFHSRDLHVSSRTTHNKRVCEIAAVVLTWSDKTTINGSTEVKRQYTEYRYFANTPSVIRHQMSITKDEWRSQWLLSIYELTDYRFQQKTWLDILNTDSHFSFTEFMCFYFDDILADISYEKYIRDGLVTEAEFYILRDWHTELGKYQSPNNLDSDSQAVLDDPAWKDLVTKGASARFELVKIVSNQEKDILQGKTTGV